jgi:hypothetical protein
MPKIIRSFGGTDISESSIEQGLTKMDIKPPCLVLIKFPKESMFIISAINLINKDLNRFGVYLHPEIEEIQGWSMECDGVMWVG